VFFISPFGGGLRGRMLTSDTNSRYPPFVRGIERKSCHAIVVNKNITTKPTAWQIAAIARPHEPLYGVCGAVSYPRMGAHPNLFMLDNKE
jgi:hypothetical protein